MISNGVTFSKAQSHMQRHTRENAKPEKSADLLSQENKHSLICGAVKVSKKPIRFCLQIFQPAFIFLNLTLTTLYGATRKH